MMAWKFSSEKAIYLQIMDKIKVDILSGTIPVGAKFNSVREMAVIAGVNPNTMQKALSELEQEAFLITDRTNGRFITQDETLLSQCKQNLAEKITNDFILSMKSIGYDNETIVIAIKKQIEEM